MRLVVVLTALTAVFGAQPSILSAGTNTWTSLGPDGGQVLAVVIDPHDSNTLYTATNNGISKSTDGAKSWNPVNAGLPTFSVSRLVIDPQNAGTLYAATFDGIFKSTDGAASWSPVSSGLPTYPNGSYVDVEALTISQQDSTTLYAGMCCDAKSVFKTTDGGVSWTPMASGLSGGVNILVADPKNPGTVYAGTQNINGLFRTTNGGSSWTVVNTKLSCCIGAVAIDPQDSNTIYVGNCCTNAATGLSKSTDGGITWATMNTGIPANPEFGSVWVTALTIDPQNSRVVYAGTLNGLYKSTDGGATWNEVDSGLPASISGMAVDPQHAGALYAGTSNGVFKSADGAVSWNAAYSGLRAQVMAIVPDPVNLSTLYAVTLTSIFKSMDGGVSWSTTNNGLPGNFIPDLAIDPRNSSTVYAGVSGGGQQTGGVFKSTDGGTSWKRSKVPEGGGVEGLKMDPQQPDTLYAWNAMGSYKSVDGAVSWKMISPASALVIDSHNSNLLYGINSGGVVQSADGGTSWSPVGTALPEVWRVRGLAIGTQNGGTLYVWDDFYDATGARLFKTTDGGADWNPANSELPGNLISSLTVDPQNESRLYAIAGGYDASGNPVDAVYTSADAGAHWTALNPGLPLQISIYALTINPQDTSQLYAATSGGTFAITITGLKGQ